MELPDAAATIEAIDFKKLYKEEKRKARLRKQTAKSNGTKAVVIDDDDIGTDSLNDSSKEPLWNFPLWEYNATLHRISESTVLDPKNDKLSGSTVSSLYYKPNFLANDDDDDSSSSYSRALLSWLQKLPTNHHITCPPAAVGRWTGLPHANRRVALFDSRIAPFPPALQPLLRSIQVAGVFDRDPRHDAGAADEEDLHRQHHPPNHILINEYTGVQGILAHTDGPVYDDCTATISFGSDALLTFEPITIDDNDHPNVPSPDDNDTTQHNSAGAAAVVKDEGDVARRKVVQVLLEAGSLIVFEGDAYSKYKHSIQQGVLQQEFATASCLNAMPGTVVERGARISITIRHKKSDSY